MNYSVGDIVVWYLHEVRQEGISPNLQDSYWGPCIITEKLNDLNFRIQYREDDSCKVVYHNKLKKCYSRHISVWCKRKNVTRKSYRVRERV